MGDSLESLLHAALGDDSGARGRLARELVLVLQQELAHVLANRARGTGRDPRQELKDLVQEVLITLFEHDLRELRRWDPERGRNLQGFVRLVARRRARRVMSGWRGNPWASDATDPVQMADSVHEATVVESLENRNELATVVHALHQRMNERDRRIFQALFVEEQAPSEVCEQEDMSRGALNAWRYRVRKLARTLAARADSTGSVSSSPVGTTGAEA